MTSIDAVPAAPVSAQISPNRRPGSHPRPSDGCGGLVGPLRCKEPPDGQLLASASVDGLARYSTHVSDGARRGRTCGRPPIGPTFQKCRASKCI